MNMIPSVRATEQGRAHFVNRKPWFVNCSLEKCHQHGLRHKSFWKKASERVRIPFLLDVPCVRCAF